MRRPVRNDSARLMPRRPHRLRRGPPREHEPEGFGDAVGAAALMLALVTSATCVGFAWDRHNRQSAHAHAVSLIQRISEDGKAALMPYWSGSGSGPRASTAIDTFEAVHRLGDFEPGQVGTCRAASLFTLCDGNRYRCHVSGVTPAGPVEAVVGICQDGKASPWSFDLVDITMPQMGNDTGNRDQVDPQRDGAIRYGVSPPLAEPLGVKLRGARWVRAFRH